VDLHDKVAVVTGASSGIGEAIARELSAAGARLVVTARREDRLVALAKSLPCESALLCAPIEDPDTPRRLLDLALSRFGRADILVNNAGVFVAGSVDTIDLDALAQMTRVNFDALVRASYVFARHFKPQRSGAIVNVSSVAAYLSSSSVGAYSGLKHAVEVFTSGLRVELGASGVRVGSIAPGTTETEIFDHLRAQGAPVRADRTPPLAPADVARALRFMLEQPGHANVARMLLVSASESV
jgi:serine 3-dehydrogenase (NADP+)